MIEILFLSNSLLEFTIRRLISAEFDNIVDVIRKKWYLRQTFA